MTAEVAVADRNSPVLPLGPLQTLRPLGADSVRITGGVWADWQRANRDVTIDHQLRWLEHDGTIDNLRRLDTPSAFAGPRRGLWFTDSDLYKAMEGIAWEAGRVPGGSRGEELRRLLRDLTAVVAGAQEPDGYVNSWVQAGLGPKWTDLAQSHELYCIGHLVQAGIAAARATGDSGLLDVARAAADLVVDSFGDGDGPRLDGHEAIEMALVELYRETGDERYLRTAARFVEARGHGTIDAGAAGSAYFQDATPVRDAIDVVGHAVRAVYLLCGAVDVAVESGDAELLRAVEQQWSTMTARKTYLTGALGSRFEGEAFGDDHELPADRGYGETCATIGGMMLSWRLLLATGRSRYADSMERALHNLFAASTDLARTGFFYNNPAQRRTVLAAASSDRRQDRADAPGTRPPWFECACCPPNVLRTVASLAGWFATGDASGAQLQQYAPMTVAVGEVRLRVSTRYPDDGVVEVLVEASPESPWELSLRIPAWAAGFTVEVGGQALDVSADDGYARILRPWSAGDVVTLTLPMEARWTVAHPSADGLRGTVALERGPVVYALESVDLDEGVDLSSVAVDAAGRVREDQVFIDGVPAVLLVAPGVEASDAWGDVGYRPLTAAAGDPVGRPTTLRFIPYALWANRGPSTMRVHVPLAPSASPSLGVAPEDRSRG